MARKPKHLLNDPQLRVPARALSQQKLTDNYSTRLSQRKPFWKSPSEAESFGFASSFETIDSKKGALGINIFDQHIDEAAAVGASEVQIWFRLNLPKIKFIDSEGKLLIEHLDQRSTLRIIYVAQRRYEKYIPYQYHDVIMVYLDILSQIRNKSRAIPGNYARLISEKYGSKSYTLLVEKELPSLEKGTRFTIKILKNRATIKHHNENALGISARLEKLEAHVQMPIANFVRELFPELAELESSQAGNRDLQVDHSSLKSMAQDASHLTLPEKAPALWAEAKEPGDTPPVFIQRHYAPWLGNGLTRADVRRLDPQLYRALANWLQNPRHSLPEGFDLPTKSETWAADPEGETPAEVREARRIVSRWDKRQARARTPER